MALLHSRILLKYAIYTKELFFKSTARLRRAHNLVGLVVQIDGSGRGCCQNSRDTSIAVRIENQSELKTAKGHISAGDRAIRYCADDDDRSPTIYSKLLFQPAKQGFVRPSGCDP